MQAKEEDMRAGSEGHWKVTALSLKLRKEGRTTGNLPHQNCSESQHRRNHNTEGITTRKEPHTHRRNHSCYINQLCSDSEFIEVKYSSRSWRWRAGCLLRNVHIHIYSILCTPLVHSESCRGLTDAPTIISVKILFCSLGKKPSRFVTQFNLRCDLTMQIW